MRRLGHGSRVQRSIGMIEVVASTLIVSVLLVAALQTVGAAQLASHKTADRRLGRLLAGELMARILPLAYVSPSFPTAALGPDIDDVARGGVYDDVDDYNGWSETLDAAGSKSLGNAVRGLHRKASVALVASNSLTGTASVTDTGFKRITVVVERDGVEIGRAVAIRTSAP